MNSDNIKYFFPKVRNRLRAERNQLWKHANLERVSMRGYVPFTEAISFKKRLQAMLGSYNADALSEITEKDKSVILNSAEQALRHEFDLLGSGSVTLNSIDWHVDSKCGARWEKKWYYEIDSIKGADIKMPWELSRCQHLLWLGEAYLLSGNEKYAKEIVDEINWWIDDNPLMYSVNWKCAMDVAFRAVNWLFTLNMIAECGSFDDLFATKVSHSLWQHAFFIRNNLEKLIPESNNHYASDIVGLLYLGVLYDYTRCGRGWKKYALKELFAETRKQVLPTGVHYERSVSYHRMMTEMLSFPLYMLKRVGVFVPDDVMMKVSSMYEYVANYTKPNGMAPLIADNDDGRFAPFLRRDFCDHNYLNDAKSVEIRMVSCGLEPLFGCTDTGTKLYSDAGVAIVRDGDNYLFVNHGGYSKTPKDNQTQLQTHTHNDLLSFELALNSEDILVDAGTYLYTSSESGRNEFRSTAKHNTIFVDGEEQNKFIGTFQIQRNVRKDKLQRVDSNTFEGSYITIEGCMKHKRVFSLVGGECIIVDFIEKQGKGHSSKLYLHFAEGIIPIINNEYLELNNGVRISFSEKPAEMAIIEDTISPSFGTLITSKTAVLTYFFDNNLQVKTIIK